MRILFIHSGADLYGSSRSLLRLTTRLVQEGDEILVILPSHGPLESELVTAEVQVSVYPHLATLSRNDFKSLIGFLGFLTKSFISIFGVLKKIHAFDPDLVHINTSVLPSAVLAGRLAGRRVVTHIRESYDDFSLIWPIYSRYLLFCSNVVVCVSYAIAAQFPAIGGRKIVVLHNGFPKAEFYPVPFERIERLRDSVGVSLTAQLVGVVGRIKLQRKGQEIFVQAAALLKKEFPDCRFLCIGSPFPGNEAHLAQLQYMISDLGVEDTVIYTGDSVDIKATIASLDIMVLPNCQPEPFGGVVVEAMAFAKPVVASMIGGNVEQVVDGETGYLVEPGNPAELASAIQRLLNNEELRREMGQKGYQRFLEKFEFEPFFQGLQEIYRGLVS
jgi:glycosyltransferase involved in cell wall biosynthesis